MIALPPQLPRLLTVFVLTSLVVGVWSVLSLRHTLQLSAHQNATQIRRLDELSRLRLSGRMLINHNQAYLLTGDPTLRQKAREEAEQVTTSIEKLRTERELPTSLKRKLDAFVQEWALYSKTMSSLFTKRREEGSPDSITSRYKKEAVPYTDKWIKLLEEISDSASQEYLDDFQKSQAAHGRILTQILMVLLTSLFLFAGAYWLNITRLRRLHAALVEETDRKNESLNLLDTFFQNCPLGLLLMDRNFRYLRVNESLAQTNGRPPALHLGHTMEEVVPQVWPHLKENLQECLESGRSVHKEVSADLPPGSGLSRHWMTGFFPVRDLQGAIVGFGGYCSDITDRRKMEMQLREWNERFNLAEEAANVGIWEWNPQTDSIVASARCKTMLGYRPHELGASLPQWIELIHPDDRERTFASWRTAIQGAQSRFSGEYRLRSKSGGYRWILSRGRINQDEQGIVHLVGANIDISEKKDAENRVQQASRLMDAILQNAPCGIALLDTQFRYVKLNKWLADLNRLPAERTLGRQVSELVPDLWPGIREGYQKVINTGLPHSIEQQDERSGALKHWRNTYYPVWGPDRALIGFGVIVVDITEIKQKEQQLIELANELKKSNTELERFAYVASHDLKEPLRMISTYLGLLYREYKGKMGPKETVYLNYCLDGAKRLNALIDSLLRFSRIGPDKMEYQKVQLSEVVEEVKASLQAAIAEAGAEVQASALPEIVGDRVQLSQLIQNLLSNALKFRRHGEQPIVQISCKVEEKAVTVTVSDNGLGIKEGDQEKIFEIFNRLHRRSEYPGEGIGLAACKKIVESHGGKIWVTSQFGTGSQFHFSLPVLRRTSHLLAAS